MAEIERRGHKFKVHKPVDCRIRVEGQGIEAEGEIYIHEATGTYRESVLGWGTDCSSLEQALDRVCKRMIERSAKPSQEELCKGMDEFYDSLE